MVPEFLFQDHPHAIWVVTVAGDGIIACNSAAERLLGIDADQVTSLSPAEVGLHALDGGRVRIGAPGCPAVEVRLAEHAGEWRGRPARFLMAEPLAVQPDGVNAAQLATRDEMLAAALKLGQFGVMEGDPANGALHCSPEALELLGLSQDRPEIGFQGFLSLLHPGDREIYESAREQASRAGRLLDVTVQIRRADDGALRHIRVISGTPLAGKDEVPRSLIEDVTEMITLREAAAQLSRRVQSVIDSMPSPFFLIGRDLRVLYVNEAGLLVLREGRGREVDPVGERLWAVFPELEAELGPGFDDLLSGGPPVATMVHLAEWNSTFRVDAFATPDGIAAHARNVTKRVLAEQALRQSEERFRLAMQAARDVIFDWDVAADVLVWSESVRDRFGYDPAVFPGNLQGWLDRVHSEDRPMMVEAIAQAGEAGREVAPQQHEYRLLRADGSVAHVISRGMSVHDAQGRVVRVVGSILDVTEIRHEDARLRAVVEVAADGIFEYDPARRVMIFSEGIRTVFGQDWVGERPVPSPWREALHPEDRERVRQDFRDFSRSAETRTRMEYRMRRGDGTYAHVREKLVALRDDSGKGVWFIGSLDDVTVEREVEERIRQSEKIEAIGKLTGGVAHDFNNLLTVILGNAELLADSRGLDAEGRRMASAILGAAERGAELTGALLAFARKQPLAPRALDTADVMEELRSLLARTLPASIDLRVIADPDVWMIEADPTQMNAALLNLAVNARDAMATGGKLTIECANARLDDAYVAAHPEATAGDFLRISVSDTGCGMAADVLGRSLEPFFTTKPPGAGSGIGLSMVHGFVRQSGGHLSLYSEPDVGTTVALYLPRSADSRAAPSDQNGDSALMSGAGEHILVVEDNDALRRHVVDLVGGLGYRVSAAADADEALTLLRARGDVDLLFTDVVMPGELNGPMLARRAAREFPALRVLFTSGYTDNAIVHHGRLDPGVQLLSKPYRRQELALKLHEALRADAYPAGG